MINVRPPGDKSISHRAVLLAAVATGPSSLRGLGDGADVRSSLGVVEALGARVVVRDGPHGLDAEITPIDSDGSAPARLECGNSGTTARLAAGLVVGLGAAASFDGDASLRARPMRRVVYPLQAMGARIEYLAETDRMPFSVAHRATGSLRTLKHRPRVASAQVKSAILLAGVLDRTAVEILEPGRSRDHTEKMLSWMGAPVRSANVGAGRLISFDAADGGGDLAPLSLDIPADPSSAAFIVGAGLLTGRPVRLEGVSGNATRTGFLRVLERMGASVRRETTGSAAGEELEAWTVDPADRLRPFEVSGDEIPGIIDEIPLLAVLAARADGRSRVREAGELRVKESDRLDLLARNLKTLGVEVEEAPDGLDVVGTERPLQGTVRSGGDHRIAMAFAVLGLSTAGEITLDDPECVGVSYPSFFQELARFEQ